MSFHPKPKIRLTDQTQTLAERIIDEDIIDLYVQNIPNDLTKDGLTNIFVSAGPIEQVKIIPSKISDSQTTYGFVRFKSKTSAMKAVQMFNNHKIGSQFLKVKFAKPVNNSNGSPTAGNGSGDASKSRNSINADAEDLDNDNWDEKKNSNKENKQRLDSESVFSQASTGASLKSVKKPMGRGQIINLIQEKHDLDPSRPYARRLMESRSRNSLNKGSESSSTVFLNPSSNVSSKTDPNKSKQYQHLKIGENYDVEITCALNPSYFYIQTLSSLNVVANLINNMSNCYQNEDEFNEVKDLKIGDYCACLIDNDWLRGQLIGIDGQKYIVRLIDFGDTYELAHDEVNLLKPEFCESQFHGAVRCSLVGIKPYKSNDWAPQSIELLKNFLHSGKSHKVRLIAKIVDYDKNNNNTCLVHLFINNEYESVIDYLLTEQLAELTSVKIDDVNKRIINKAEKEEMLNAKKPDQPPEYIQPSEKSSKQIEPSSPGGIKTKSKQGINALKYVALMEVGEKYEATVIYVSDKTKIFLVENSQISQIIEIQEHINSQEFLLNCTAEIGGSNEKKLNNTDLVVALYELDETWYRAIVIDNKVTEDNKIKLFFVDYGNEEYIKLNNIRCVVSNDDKIFHQTFKINNCDLNLADSLTTDNKFVIEQLKNLEGTNVIIKILNLGKLSLSSKLTVENYLRNYVVTLYMDKNDETNNEQRLLKLLSSQQPHNKAQKSSQNELSQFADADENCQKLSPSSRFIKLIKNKTYKVNFQYYDQNSNNIYFYLNENYDKLNKLQSYLQDAIENGFDYINSVKDIDTNEQYEALFKEDFKWYRCIVTNIEKNSIHVYFVDYGNLEKLDLHEIKLSDYLRKRKVKKNDDIYKIDYQAIKGKYLKSFEEFAEEIPAYIQETNDNDAFYIKCVDSNENEFKFELKKYESENDQEVSDILLSSFRQQQQEVEKEENKLDFELHCDQIYKCKYVVVDSPDEFYVHLIDNSAQLEKIEKYLTELTEKPSGSFEKFTTQLPVNNEIVLAKFEGIWYRAKVIEAKIKSQIKVYFIDYGNYDENCTLDNMLKINKIKNDILDLPPLAYCVRLNKIKIDLEIHQDILTQILSQEIFLVKCISIDKNDNKTVYNIEIYDSDNQVCFNELFDNKGEEEDSTAIDQPNIVVDGLKILNAQYCCFDEFEKPIYLMMSEDILKCETLSCDLNSYYSKNSNSDSIKDENDIQIGEYYAIKHEDGNWYRAKLLGIDKKTKLISFRLIDFGFIERDMKYLNKDEFLIKKLNNMFRKQHRHVFRAFLSDITETNKIEFKNLDKIKDHIENYFFENIDENKKKDVKVRVISSFGNDDEDCDLIYAVEILNNKNESLNKVIHLENEALKKPVIVDKFHKINLKQLPKEKFDVTKMYHLFVKRVDYFYAFDDNVVKQIQEDVVETCRNILSMNNEFNFKNNAKNLPEIGNLIFANYEEFVYRCEIKNFNDNFEEFELFFIDFGNTEIVSRSDIMLPFTEKHVECFTKYPPQAYKSKLYGLKDTETNREPFKNLVFDKKFKIKVIKKCIDANENTTHEIQLFHQDTKLDVHWFLIDNHLAKFDLISFDAILNSIKTNEEIEFYSEQLKMLKLKLKL